LSILNAFLDFFGGKKIDEKFVPIRNGKLKIILKERNNEKYIYMRFSYAGNTQYHALHKESVNEAIQTLTDFRNQL